MEENHKIYFLSSSEFPTYFRYVGRTMRELSYRLAQHVREKFENYKCRWIKKELKKGNKIIITEIETNISRENIPSKEVYYFKLLLELGYSLTNGTECGEGVMIPTKEQREATAKRNIGNRYGYRPHTEESKLKMSIAKKGKPNGREGKKMSKEFSEKMSLIHKGKKISQEQKDHLSKIFKGKKLPEKAIINAAKKRRKKVIIKDFNTNEIIKKFESFKEAAEYLKVNPSSISNIVAGRFPHVKGFKLELA